MMPTSQIIQMPLEIVALFAHEVPAGLSAVGHPMPRFEASVLPEVPALNGPRSEFALLMTGDEQRAAAAARAALLVRFHGEWATSARLAAGVEHILDCHAHDAVAIVLPAARKAIGRSALANLSHALAGSE